jgi:drug/metabolite transporter (DMT)-like permease
VLALAVAASIAGYTLVDAEGVHHAPLVPYLCLVLGVPGLLSLAALAVHDAPRLRTAWDPRGTPALAVGMFGAFGLALAALQHGPAAGVSAVRESSIVLAVVLARVTLGEPVGRVRLAGAGVVAAGVVAVALA